MKSTFKFLTLCLSLLVIWLVWWCLCKKCPPPPPIKEEGCYIELRVPATDGRDSTIRVPYRCNELIVRNPDKAVLDDLKQKGFTPIDTCSCNEGLILFRSQGVDPMGIVDNPPAGTKDSSMTLNYIILPEPRDTFDYRDKPLDQFPPYPTPGKDIIKVAILDTGTDPDHTWLRNALWINPGDKGCPGFPIWPNGLDMTDYSQPIDVKGHGTHVGGIVAGYSDPILSPNTNVRIELMNVKITDDRNDQADLFKATCGMHYAIKQGAKVMNLSWGYYTYTPVSKKGGAIDKDNEYPTIMLDALEEATNKGVVIVAALGNEEKVISDSIRFWPACFSETWENVISVAALNQATNNKATFSNYSDNPALMTLMAPGEQIISTVPNVIRRIGPLGFSTYTTNGFASSSGTSMAAPFVARTVALMMGKSMPSPANIGNIKSTLVATQQSLPLTPYRKMDASTALSAW